MPSARFRKVNNPEEKRPQTQATEFFYFSVPAPVRSKVNISVDMLSPNRSFMQHRQSLPPVDTTPPKLIESSDPAKIFEKKIPTLKHSRKNNKNNIIKHASSPFKLPNSGCTLYLDQDSDTERDDAEAILKTQMETV